MPRPTSALIIDDETHVRTYLRLLLRELGIEQTWEAPDGASAFVAVAEHKPELVLLDINLPAMSGLDVLAQLKQRQPDLPVIIVSAQNAVGTVIEAVRLGAAAYVLKHSPKDEALSALRDALDGLENGETVEEE